MTTQTTSDAALSAIRTIRLAWLDEKLEAEARGDAVAAAEAAHNLSTCELQIRQLEKRLGAKFAGSEGPFRAAWEALRLRV
jgi:hypothetical protein